MRSGWLAVFFPAELLLVVHGVGIFMNLESLFLLFGAVPDGPGIGSSTSSRLYHKSCLSVVTHVARLAVPSPFVPDGCVPPSMVCHPANSMLTMSCDVTAAWFRKGKAARRGNLHACGGNKWAMIAVCLNIFMV